MWLFRSKIYLLLLFVVGCTFTPIYSNKDNKINDSLAAIEIKDVNETDKQNILLVEQLQDSLNVLNKDIPKKYVLEIQYTTDLNSTLVNRNLDFTTIKISLNFKYVLKDKYTNKELNRGQLSSSGTFNVSKSELATYNAENYLEHTLVKYISDNLKESLSTTIFKWQL